MISLEKAVIARLSKGGKKFEVLVDPDKALEMKAGKDFPLDDFAASMEIFEDSKKGKRASDEDINSVFGTTDPEIIIKKIVKEGDVQLTTDQRNTMLEEKTKAIASIISKRGVNPQTNLPHPLERVLRAMKQAKVKIDLEKRTEEQLKRVQKEIQTILPLKFEKVQLAIKIPPQFAAKSSSIIRNFGSLLKEEWASDGSYIALIQVPAAIQQEIYDRLNSLTHGQVELKIVKKGD
jgi:ribosome maturation protein SDO1